MSEEVTYRGEKMIRTILFGRSTESPIRRPDLFKGRRTIVYEPFVGTDQEWTRTRQYFKISVYPEPFDKPENFKVFMECPFCSPEEAQPFTRLISMRTHLQRRHKDLVKRYVKRITYFERV